MIWNEKRPDLKSDKVYWDRIGQKYRIERNHYYATRGLLSRMAYGILDLWGNAMDCIKRNWRRNDSSSDRKHGSNHPNDTSQRPDYSKTNRVPPIPADINGEFMKDLDPYPFQRIGVRRIERFGGRALLADEMGLGKTCQSIWWLRYYYKLDQPIIVVCPKSIMFNWVREVKRFGGKKFYTEIIEAGMKPHRNFFRGKPKKTVYIINYDILYKWIDFLVKAKPGCVIADECHYTKSRGAKRTKCLRVLAEHSPHMIAISGTPLTNRPAELWSILNMIRPEEWPSFYSYSRRYCAPRMTPWGIKHDGARHLDELHDRLKLSCMIRRKKNQVFKEMPPIIWDVVRLSVNNRREYDLAERDFKKWMRDEFPHKAAKIKNNEAMAKYGYLRRLIGKLKMDAVREWLDNYLQDTEDKLIAFGVHRQMVRDYHDLYKENSVYVHGGVTGQNRQRAFDSFQDDKKIQLLFANSAAYVGWNGQVASNILFYELFDRPADHGQAAARAHRIGQKGQVWAGFLVVPNTIEEQLAQKLTSKQNVLDAVLDGAIQEDSFDLVSLLSEVSRG